MTVAEVEKVANELSQGELIDLTERLYHKINFPEDDERLDRIRIADEREKAASLDAEGNTNYDEFISDLKDSL